MAGRLIETVYGSRATYEIREQPSCRSVKFVIYRNGSPWRGEYLSVSRAVEVAKRGG